MCIYIYIYISITTLYSDIFIGALPQQQPQLRGGREGPRAGGEELLDRQVALCIIYIYREREIEIDIDIYT